MSEVEGFFCLFLSFYYFLRFSSTKISSGEGLFVIKPNPTPYETDPISYDPILLLTDILYRQ